MSFWVSLLNNIAVSLFGSILSVSFCDELATRRKRRIFLCCMALLPLLQQNPNPWEQSFVNDKVSWCICIAAPSLLG